MKIKSHSLLCILATIACMFVPNTYDLYWNISVDKFLERMKKESKLNRNLTYQVDPSTVCQFTGLKDCDGKEIWEGDMLSNVTNDSPDGIVVFKYGAFSLLAKNGRDFCVALTYLMSEKDSLNRFKVVGNKFDKEK